jgi:hypothetical protein
MKTIAVIVGVMLLCGGRALQSQGQVPAPIEEGLKALRTGGTDPAAAAVAPWTRTWTTPADSGKRTRLENGLRELVAYAGALKDWDVVKTVDVTPHVKRVYLVLVFERQPVYAMFVAYRPASDWIVTSVNFHTDPARIFPSTVLEPEKP